MSRQYYNHRRMNVKYLNPGKHNSPYKGYNGNGNGMKHKQVRFTHGLGGGNGSDYSMTAPPPTPPHTNDGDGKHNDMNTPVDPYAAAAHALDFLCPNCDIHAEHIHEFVKVVNDAKIADFDEVNNTVSLHPLICKTYGYDPKTKKIVTKDKEGNIIRQKEVLNVLASSSYSLHGDHGVLNRLINFRFRCTHFKKCFDVSNGLDSIGAFWPKFVYDKRDIEEKPAWQREIYEQAKKYNGKINLELFYKLICYQSKRLLSVKTKCLKMIQMHRKEMSDTSMEIEKEHQQKRRREDPLEDANVKPEKKNKRDDHDKGKDGDSEGDVMKQLLAALKINGEKQQQEFQRRQEAAMKAIKAENKQHLRALKASMEGGGYNSRHEPEMDEEGPIYEHRSKFITPIKDDNEIYRGDYPALPQRRRQRPRQRQLELNSKDSRGRRRHDRGDVSNKQPNRRRLLNSKAKNKNKKKSNKRIMTALTPRHLIKAALRKNRDEQEDDEDEISLRDLQRRRRQAAKAAKQKKHKEEQETAMELEHSNEEGSEMDSGEDDEENDDQEHGDEDESEIHDKDEEDEDHVKKEDKQDDLDKAMKQLSNKQIKSKTKQYATNPIHVKWMTDTNENPTESQIYNTDKCIRYNYSIAKDELLTLYLFIQNEHGTNTDAMTIRKAQKTIKEFCDELSSKTKKSDVHTHFGELEGQDALFDFLVEIMALTVTGDLFQYYDDHSQLFRIIAYYNRTYNARKDRDEAVKKSKIALKREKERAEAKAEAKTEETDK